jgi:transcriptional regulator with XRE-family HTH domain
MVMPRAQCVVIPTKLMRLRAANGFTQEDLAVKAGVERRTIQRAEAGLRVTASTLHRMAEALNVDTNELLRQDGVELRIPALEAFNDLIDSVRVRSSEFIRQVDGLRITFAGRPREFGLAATEAKKDCQHRIDRDSKCADLALKLRLAFISNFTANDWRFFFERAQRSFAQFQLVVISTAVNGENLGGDNAVEQARRAAIKILVERRDDLIMELKTS